MQDDAQRQAEMERGREIGQRNQRKHDLDRLLAAGKVGRYFWPVMTDHARHIVDGVCVGDVNVNDEDYPSVVLMATIMLAVNATVGLGNLPPAETTPPDVRARRNEYRDRMRRNLSASQG